MRRLLPGQAEGPEKEISSKRLLGDSRCAAGACQGLWTGPLCKRKAGPETIGRSRGVLRGRRAGYHAMRRLGRDWDEAARSRDERSFRRFLWPVAGFGSMLPGVPPVERKR